MKKNKKYLWAFPMFLVLCASYLSFEDSVLKTTYYDVENYRIPSAFNGFKIAQISDFHNVEIKWLRNQIINKLIEENPSIIVITGDLIDSNTPNIDIVMDFIEQISKIAPIYFVIGNHETASKSHYSVLKDVLLKYGVYVLENDVEVLVKDGKEINILGVNDTSAFHAHSINNSDLFRIEINDLEYNRDLFTILLSHRPHLFPVYVEGKYDLVFCGHAHGGQIRVPFIGGLYAPGQGFFPKYTAGVYKEEDTTMIVSRGIGNSTFPFRVNNRPELVITSLYSKEY